MDSLIPRLEPWKKIVVHPVGYLYGDINGVENIRSERQAFQLAIEEIVEFTSIRLIWPHYCYTFESSIPKVPSIYSRNNYETVTSYTRSAERIVILISCLTVGGLVYCSNFLRYKNKKSSEIIESWQIIEHESGVISVNSTHSNWVGSLESFNSEWSVYA